MYGELWVMNYGGSMWAWLLSTLLFFQFKIFQVFNGELVYVFHEYLNLWFGYLKVL